MFYRFLYFERNNLSSKQNTTKEQKNMKITYNEEIELYQEHKHDYLVIIILCKFLLNIM